MRSNRESDEGNKGFIIVVNKINIYGMSLRDVISS